MRKIQGLFAFRDVVGRPQEILDGHLVAVLPGAHVQEFLGVEDPADIPGLILVEGTRE